MRKLILCLVFLISLSFLLLSCTNPYSKFYFDKTGGVDITKVPGVIISKDQPKLYRGTTPEIDLEKMMEEGYALVGYSNFNAANIDVNSAIRQAEKVNASVVIVYSKYTNTISGSIPIILPDTQTSTTNIYGNVSGSGGVASYSGTAQTTTYGTTTTYIPYSTNRYDYFATYWVKQMTIFGARVIDLTSDMRSKIGSNKGVIVRAIIKNSPAFRADILKGDILKQIGDMEIMDVTSCQAALFRYAGTKVNVLILRNAQEISKEIEFNKKY